MIQFADRSRCSSSVGPDILNLDAIDVGIDIGLARWRYATWRMEEPENLSALELIAWWGETLRKWFEGLSEDLELFERLYAHLLQRLQTGLTSGGEKQ